MTSAKEPGALGRIHPGEARCTAGTLDDLASALAASVTVPSRIVGRFEATRVDARCAGPALTVAATGGDNLPLHRALVTARPGQVLVAALHGSDAAGHWGSLMTRAAQRSGLAGVVVDGSVRDRAELATLDPPVFFRGLCPRKASKRAEGAVGAPVTIDGVTIATGDIVVADIDGVVAFAGNDLARMLEAVHALRVAEAEIARRIDAGAPLPDAFGLLLDRPGDSR